MAFRQRCHGSDRINHKGIWRKKITSRENILCKCPESEICVEHISRNSKRPVYSKIITEVK